MASRPLPSAHSFSHEFDRFLAALDLPFVSPMDRVVKMAEALDSSAMLAMYLPRVGDMRGSIRWHRDALTRPGLNHRLVLESLIQMLDRETATTPAEARAIRQTWWDRFGRPCVARQRPCLNDRDPERPLRVGYVSANFKHSSAGNCLEGVILQHSDAILPFCYSTQAVALREPITLLFHLRSNLFDISALEEAQLAERIRADRIDILIDCMGCTYGNRLAAFAERPAPIQLTGWGYATGTMPAMDGILLDPVTAGCDDFFEAVIELPCVVTYAAPVFSPPVAPQPTGPVTFGAFHAFHKINDDVLRVWRRILDAVPDSRIVFKGKEYGERLLRERFQAALGGRCAFWPQTEHLAHLGAFQHIDLVLDPWPQTAVITACEALHQGVVTVTLMGARTVQRGAASILRLVGFEDGITTSEDAYVARAVELVTTRRGELATERPHWRARLRESPIVQGYTAAAEGVFRQLWRAWCAKGECHV